MPLRLAAKHTPEELEAMQDLFHCDSDLQPLSSTVVAASTHDFYVPIGHIFKDCILEHTDDLFFDITSRSLTESGTGYTVTVNNAHFVIPTDAVQHQDANAALQLRRGAVVSRRIIEFIPTQRLSVTATAGAKISPSIDLDVFVGKSAGLLVVFRLASDDSVPVIPGDTLVDVVSASGRSETGLGTEVKYELIAGHTFKRLAGFLRAGSKTYRYLLIPFTDSVGDALNDGSMSGCRFFRTDRDRLEITMGTTGWTNGSYTLTVYNLQLKTLSLHNNRWEVTDN